MEWLAILMFVVICLVLLLGYPVAFSLAGTALIFAGVGHVFGVFDSSLLNALPSRIYGIITNQTLLAVPLFVFMGVMLEKSKVAEDLLQSMTQVFGRLPAGLGIAVTIVGALMAASTGIVGATVVTMGLLALPTMQKQGYEPSYSTGVIAATGTLGQIIPPSIALVLLGDVLSSAYQQSQLAQGIFSPETISVGDLFAGAIVPGLILVGMYLLYSLAIGVFKPEWTPKANNSEPLHLMELLKSLVPPLLLIVLVLGSILLGIATPTEAAGIGAFGAGIIALAKRQLNKETLHAVMTSTLSVTSMVFMILIGASIFSLVFRGFGGEELVQELFINMPGGELGALLIVMAVIFLLGFILDFIEITFVVVPIVAPVLFMLGIDPIWLGIMIAINLQTSFLTPPFGFALFYLRGVTPDSIPTSKIYKGVLPFIIMQIIMLVVLMIWPELATSLPKLIYS
ncbi:TRAP transporter large permease subunit [Psychrosphaera ytuae]|uniref:TRAP transporter large permease protein n=1 Tax=Psychrosphaera ytuae TaxID=2820710 RepID=A0A975HHU7_9GAMM|nr:TRAP transporter large permease subunit [Psychrosphaera ytuae]QTH63477.1 TRAP transporter large permease subunit [Psychrosphaera ytuae]